MSDFLQEWVEALESDKYQQGVGYLCSEGKYCCLGVACEVAKLPFTISEDLKYYFEDCKTITNENPLHSLLKDKGEIPTLFYRGQDHSCLATLNDRGIPFKDIAIIVRKYYLGEDLPLPEGVEES